MTYDLYNEIKDCIQKTKIDSGKCIFYGQQLESLEFAKVLGVILTKYNDHTFLTTLRQVIADIEEETPANHSVYDKEEEALTTNQKVAVYTKAFGKLMRCIDGRSEEEEVMLQAILAPSLSAATLEKCRVFISENSKGNCSFENGMEITSIIEVLKILNSPTIEKNPIFAEILKHGMSSYIYEYFREAGTDDNYGIKIDDQNCTDTSSTMRVCMDTSFGGQITYTKSKK